MRPRRAAARGAVLIEVVAALTIFAFAAVATLALVSQSDAAEAQAREVERGTADQDRLIVAASLLSRDDLEDRLGVRSAGAWLVRVRRIEPTLYEVSVGDSLGGSLVTLLHRPELSRAR